MKRPSLEVIRGVALWSMIAALSLGTLSWIFDSVLHDSSLISELTTTSFLIWAFCGVILWITAWSWLFRTWVGRGTLNNLLWCLALAVGSIILPIVFYRRFNGTVANAAEHDQGIA